MIQTGSAQIIHPSHTGQAPGDREHGNGVIMNKQLWGGYNSFKKLFTLLFQGICKHIEEKMSGVHGITLTNG